LACHQHLFSAFGKLAERGAGDHEFWELFLKFSFVSEVIEISKINNENMFVWYIQILKEQHSILV
jgi:hypothetical protein